MTRPAQCSFSVSELHHLGRHRPRFSKMTTPTAMKNAVVFIVQSVTHKTIQYPGLSVAGRPVVHLQPAQPAKGGSLDPRGDLLVLQHHQECILRSRSLKLQFSTSLAKRWLACPVLACCSHEKSRWLAHRLPVPSKHCSANSICSRPSAHCTTTTTVLEMHIQLCWSSATNQHHHHAFGFHAHCCLSGIIFKPLLIRVLFEP